MKRLVVVMRCYSAISSTDIVNTLRYCLRRRVDRQSPFTLNAPIPWAFLQSAWSISMKVTMGRRNHCPKPFSFHFPFTSPSFLRVFCFPFATPTLPKDIFDREILLPARSLCFVHSLRNIYQLFPPTYLHQRPRSPHVSCSTYSTQLEYHPIRVGP